MNTFCHYYNKGVCESCKQIEKPYEEQIKIKQETLIKLLSSWPNYELLEPVKSETLGFRNKAKLIITGSIEEPIIGLAGKVELDEGRDIRSCPLHHARINEFILTLPSFINKSKLRPYQIKEKNGELKGIIIYYSPASDSMYVRFILRSKESIDRIRKNSSHLLEHAPKNFVLSANIQPIPHAIMEGNEEIFITDSQSIPHQMNNVSMSLHPKGFVQTNQSTAYELYSTAAAWVSQTKAKTFLELFCGQGAFSFFIQNSVDRAIGVEINQEAVERANLTAYQSGLSHLRFIAQDASKVSKVVQQFKPQVLLVNPPRRGLGEALKVVKDSDSDFIIYSSCNAETLAKDLEDLREYYQLKKAQIFDMFPHTDHFETLALLKRRTMVL